MMRDEKVQKWLHFEKELSGWLSSHSTEEVHFRNPNQAIIGFPSNGFRSDGMLTDGKTLLAIEVEARQMHPDTNVGKYWLLMEKFPKYNKVILFHIFTPAFNSYEWRMKLAGFYAEKMAAVFPFQYHLRDIRSEIDYEGALGKLKIEIQTVIGHEFNKSTLEII